ncbi:MAG: GHKL domain-containing protein [Pseudobutyrivibrio sp.]|nr:GHKL domain-containing protein [Pseudobutyrivibrio sp.]
MMGQDIPKLYTAFAEWMSCVMILIIHRNRINIGTVKKIVGILGMSLILLSLIQLFCGKVKGVFWLGGMLIAILIMIGTIHFCLDMNFMDSVYYTAGAFIWAEFAAAIEWQLESFYAPFIGKNIVIESLFCILMYSIVCGIFLTAEHLVWKDSFARHFVTIVPSDILRVWISVVLFFALSNLSYVSIKSPFSGTSMEEIFNIRTLVDFAGIIMLELFHIQKAENDGRRELDSIKQTLYMQYMQYRQSSENMELINQKYHDLKHQLQVIRAEEDNQKRINYLDELEQNICFYDTEIKTGNNVLDTILTEKARQCLKQNINMTVVADGSLINYMHVMDIATIFGNALDNAIEHEVLVEDNSKRMIHVTISKHEGLIHIIIENMFMGKLKSEGNSILTTKSDNRFHGYGLKSIKYTIEKYDGLMAAQVENGWFRLKIMLPVK